MPYAVYKLTHLLGIFVLIITLALPFMHMLRGGTRAGWRSLRRSQSRCGRRRAPAQLLIGTPLLALLAAGLAIYKPFQGA
jgi:hypothetical protein